MRAAVPIDEGRNCILPVRHCNSEAEIDAQANKATALSTTSNMDGRKPMALPELTARLHDFYSKLNPSKLSLVVARSFKSLLRCCARLLAPSLGSLACSASASLGAFFCQYPQSVLSILMSNACQRLRGWLLKRISIILLTCCACAPAVLAVAGDAASPAF